MFESQHAKEKKISYLLQTALTYLGRTQPLILWVTGSFQEVQRLRRAEIKNEWSLISTPPIYEGNTDEINFYISDLFHQLNMCLSSGSGTARHLLI